MTARGCLARQKTRIIFATVQLFFIATFPYSGSGTLTFFLGCFKYVYLGLKRMMCKIEVDGTRKSRDSTRQECVQLEFSTFRPNMHCHHCGKNLRNYIFPSRTWDKYLGNISYMNSSLESPSSCNEYSKPQSRDKFAKWLLKKKLHRSENNRLFYLTQQPLAVILH
jgi:hypothetical protein